MSYLSSSEHRSDNHNRALGLAALGPAGNLPVPTLAAAACKPQLTAEALTSLALLRGLEPDTALQLAQRAVVRRLPRHAMVIEQGSQESGLFILLKGQTQVVRHNKRGRTLVVDQLRPGEHFGELSAIDGLPQYASVRCTLPSEVLVISRGDFIDALHESPALLQALLQSTVDRLRRKNRRITLLALHDVRGCVVQQLLDLAEHNGGQALVRGRINRQAIADMIGASRAMVSRVMMALLRSGEIQTLADGSTAILCDATGPAGQAQQPQPQPQPQPQQPDMAGRDGPDDSTPG